MTFQGKITHKLIGVALVRKVLGIDKKEKLVLDPRAIHNKIISPISVMSVSQKKDKQEKINKMFSYSHSAISNSFFL